MYIHIDNNVFTRIRQFFSNFFVKCKVLHVTINAAFQLYKCVVRMIDRTCARLIEERPLTDHQTRQP